MESESSAGAKGKPNRAVMMLMWVLEMGNSPNIDRSGAIAGTAGALDRLSIRPPRDHKHWQVMTAEPTCSGRESDETCVE